MEISLSNRQRSVQLDLKWLRRFSKIALAECLKHQACSKPVLPGLENVDVVIVSDRVIADVHRRFMNIPGPTDVITFDHGEIVTSAQTAALYARQYGHGVDRELALYIIHGLLHLNGYDDHTRSDA